MVKNLFFEHFFFKESKINHESNTGQSPKSVIGSIEYKNVEFNYPAREDVQVLKNLTLRIKPGETVALVGSSGCKTLSLSLLHSNQYNLLFYYFYKVVNQLVFNYYNVFMIHLMVQYQSMVLI
jgi:ABC-type multidrug transport system fused ATPase/permease subunit